MSKVSYPCLYGLREYCEAITIIMQQLQPSTIPIEPKTDEEKVVKRLAEAFLKYFPTSQPISNVTRAINDICELCPHRLAKLKELGALQSTSTTSSVSWPLPPVESGR